MHKHSIAILTATVAALLAGSAHAQDASFERLGVGCAGSASVPTLDAAAGNLPRIGESISLSKWVVTIF